MFPTYIIVVLNKLHDFRKFNKPYTFRKSSLPELHWSNCSRISLAHRLMYGDYRCLDNFPAVTANRVPLCGDGVVEGTFLLAKNIRT